MNIILHGATDFGSSNYGDFLYGKIIYDYLVNQEGLFPNNIFFYNPSLFFEKYIDDSRTVKLKGRITDSDLGIYIPGGYFGEGHNPSWKDNILQIIRFIPFGIKCILLKIPYAVIGVGAGPNDSYLLSKFIKIITRHSEVITVRDKESLLSLRSLGCDNSIICCFDPIIAVDLYAYDAPLSINNSCFTIIEKLNKQSKKGLLVHFNHSIEAARKFGEAVRIFLDENSEFYPVVTFDQYLEGKEEIISSFENAFGSDSYLLYDYDNPYEFGSLISAMGFVLTSKLHVGVTAVVKNKPTLAVAVHPEKTSRFYNNINAPYLYCDIDLVDGKTIASKMSLAIDKKIVIPKEIVKNAINNFFELERFIESH